VKRRAFITLLGGAAAVWPLAVRAQQERMRRIGMVMPNVESDPVGQAFVEAFRGALRSLGWTDGGNARIDIRWAAGEASDPNRLRGYAAELVGLQPDVIVAGATSALTPLQQATQTIPIVFCAASDPVGGGFVKSLARPGGNITGFALYEYAMGVKWLELLNQIAPRVNRVAVIYDPDNRSSLGQLPEIENREPSFGMRLSAFPVRDAPEIERAIDAFAVGPNGGGLIVLPNPVTVTHRKLIIAQAAKRRLPAVYAYRFYVTSGGLASYGVDIFDLFRRAASYVDRILKGENPGELPVQYADKFELVINLKTAKALNLDPPISLLARTDEVIE
jgi:putative ABC transport system substrate-binding protein